MVTPAMHAMLVIVTAFKPAAPELTEDSNTRSYVLNAQRVFAAQRIALRSPREWPLGVGVRGFRPAPTQASTLRLTRAMRVRPTEGQG